MKTLLYVDCCIRREQSRTRKLAESFLGNLPKGWRVEKVVLMDEPLLPLMEGGFAQRDELLQRGDFTHRRFDYAWQFQKADAILIAAPFYDLSIPALLKVYIENVSVDGITFLCDAQGLRGNCRAESMTFLTSRGGFYENSPDEMGSRYKARSGEPSLRYMRTSHGARHGVTRIYPRPHPQNPCRALI